MILPANAVAPALALPFLSALLSAQLRLNDIVPAGISYVLTMSINLERHMSLIRIIASLSSLSILVHFHSTIYQLENFIKKSKTRLWFERHQLSSINRLPEEGKWVDFCSKLFSKLFEFRVDFENNQQIFIHLFGKVFWQEFNQPVEIVKTTMSHVDSNWRNWYLNPISHSIYNWFILALVILFFFYYFIVLFRIHYSNN